MPSTEFRPAGRPEPLSDLGGVSPRYLAHALLRKHVPAFPLHEPVSQVMHRLNCETDSTVSPAVRPFLRDAANAEMLALNESGILVVAPLDPLVAIAVGDDTAVSWRDPVTPQPEASP
jgi:hypothetical protein